LIRQDFMKRLIYTLLFLFPAVSIASRGEWSIGGKLGIEQNNSNAGFKAAVKAEYNISKFLKWRTDFEVFFPDLNDAARVDISVPSNLLYYPLGSYLKIDPYIGPGLTYKYTWNGDNYLGLNALAGVNFHLIKDNVFGIEAKYTFLFVPELRGAWEVGLTGTWELNFGR